MFFYYVRPGDTLYKISALFRVPVEALLAANPGVIPTDLLIGQQIRIPLEYTEAPVQPGEQPRRPF